MIRHQMVIDYTDVSEPVTVDRAYADIQQAALAFGDDAVEFLMWEHQWDWMIKDADANHNYQSYIWGGGTRWLWGLRVNLADTAAPVAIIEPGATDADAEEIRSRFAEIEPPYIAILRDLQASILEKAKRGD